MSSEPPTEKLEPGAPCVLRRGIELDADLRDRVSLHVAHDQLHGAEARPVSDGGCSIEPARQKLYESHSVISHRCRIVEMRDRGERGSSVGGEIPVKPPPAPPARARGR